MYVDLIVLLTNIYKNKMKLKSEWYCEVTKQEEVILNREIRDFMEEAVFKAMPWKMSRTLSDWEGERSISQAKT